MRQKIKTVRKPRQKNEATLQKSFFQWLRLCYPNMYPLAFAIPNGGLRNVIVARELKSTGVKPGVPDVFIAYPIHGAHGLFIEFKHGANKATKLQSIMINELIKNGYVCAVCNTIDHAMEVVKRYCAGTSNILNFKGQHV